jgi:NAD(P)-dependent dehydrogenase (short-subunit alcohol dehydrogenase family)
MLLDSFASCKNLSLPALLPSQLVRRQTPFIKARHSASKGRNVMKLQGSKVLVTGSNRGIGRSLVQALLARGAATVYAAARDPKALAGLVAESGERVVPVQLDITNAVEVAAAGKLVDSLDLLINNAGLLGSGGLLDGSLEAIERDMRTNYFGTLAVTRALLPAIEKQKGSIVNVLTVVALASMPGLGGYSASKAAALSLTQALRGELGKRGIGVTAVFPGPVDTDMAREITLPKTSPAEVAKAILDGLERGDEDIFPDAMAQQVGGEFAKAPKNVERMFAAM